MRKVQTGAKHKRNYWKNVCERTAKRAMDYAGQIERLKQELADEKKAHEQTAELANERRIKIDEISLALRDAQTTKNQLAIANTDIKIVEECIREICDHFRCAKDNDNFRLATSRFMKLPTNMDLTSLSDYIDDFSTRATETKNALADAEVETKKREAVADALTEIIQKAIRR
jgi:hypothetical protein